MIHPLTPTLFRQPSEAEIEVARKFWKRVKLYRQKDLPADVRVAGAKAFSKARTSLLLDHPFFGNLALKLIPVQVGAEWFARIGNAPTAAVDGKHFFYYPPFFLALDESERQGLAAHEVLHCALSHFSRRKGRNPSRWNEAGDYVINATCVQSKLSLPPGGLLDVEGITKDDGMMMSTDEVYALLKEEDEQEKENEPEPEDNEPEDGDDDESEGGGSDESDDESEDEPDDESGSGSDDSEDEGDEEDDADGGSGDDTEDDEGEDDGSGSGSDDDESEEGDDKGDGSGKGDDTEDGDADGDGDAEGDAEGSDDSEGDGSGSDGDGDESDAGGAEDPSESGGSGDGADFENGDPAEPGDWNWGGVVDAPEGTTDREKKEMENDWKVAVIQAAMAAQKAGNLPACVERLVDEIKAPKLDWREVLQNFANDFARDDYTWAMPNRRTIGSGVYLPGLRSEDLGEIFIAIDTSLSISEDDLAQFQGEINDILEKYSGVKLTIFYCDTEVKRDEDGEYAIDEFEPCDAPVTLRNIGGGGTRFSPVFRFIEDRGFDPVCLVYLTDLESSDFGEEPLFPVLWIQTGNYGETPPFGEVTRLIDKGE